PSAHDLHAALAQLPDTQRAILVLRYQEELDYRQIGEILDVAPGTVASRLSRARDALRRLLAEESAQAREETRTSAHPTDGEDGAASVMQ
ncbi:MAG: sigma-70 family RNA polymerase sigma factor, partial [Planctomycetota bacterium]